MDTNKRRFQRIPFDAHISLTIDEQDTTITGSLHDISLKGALIEVADDFPALAENAQGELTISPDQGDIELKLTVQVAYRLAQRHAYGLNVLSLDVDSAAHLKRLVEVNLGNEESLQRELSNLIEAMEQEHESP